MFANAASVIGFLVGVGLTVGLLVTPHLLPWGYGLGLSMSGFQLVLLFVTGFAVLAAVLWTAGRLIREARVWKEPRVILAAVLIAVVANTLYSILVELLALPPGWRALIAVLGVPVIYGNLGAVLGKVSLKTSMLNIFQSALATLGAGFIIASIIRGWGAV